MQVGEFVEVGGELLSAAFCSPEARYRSAVGRAYCGAYHEACELARACGESWKGKDHDLVVKALYRLAIATGDDSFRVVAGALKSLHASRRKADYQFEPAASASFTTATFSVMQVTDGKKLLIDMAALRKKHVK